jgi:hypothetical protein
MAALTAVVFLEKVWRSINDAERRLVARAAVGERLRSVIGVSASGQARRHG